MRFKEISWKYTYQVETVENYLSKQVVQPGTPGWGERASVHKPYGVRALELFSLFGNARLMQLSSGPKAGKVYGVCLRLGGDFAVPGEGPDGTEVPSEYGAFIDPELDWMEAERAYRVRWEALKNDAGEYCIEFFVGEDLDACRLLVEEQVEDAVNKEGGSAYVYFEQAAIDIEGKTLVDDFAGQVMEALGFERNEEYDDSSAGPGEPHWLYWENDA